MESSWIENHIRREMSLHGGYFLFFDRRQKQMLALQLRDPVDPSRVVRSNDNQYAACVTLYSEKGEPFDLDFILRTNEECTQVEGIAMHSTTGIPRYRWQKDNSGYWKQHPYWEKTKEQIH